LATFVYSALESTAEEVVGLCCQGLAGFDALVLDHAVVLLDFTMKPDSVFVFGRTDPTRANSFHNPFHGATICLYNNDNHLAITLILVCLTLLFV